MQTGSLGADHSKAGLGQSIRRGVDRVSTFSPLAYSAGVILVIWGINIFYTVASPGEWQAHDLDILHAMTMMIIVLGIITTLAAFPALIYWAFEQTGKKAAGERVFAELDRDNLLTKGVKTQVENSLAKAYSPDSYRLPVFLATASAAVGWVFVFFGNGPDPVWQLAETRNLGEFALTLRAGHPIVFAFMGAYFFSLQVLVRRYFTADLKASVFMHISVRIWLVMILTLVLSIVWPAIPLPGEGTTSTAPDAETLALIAVCFISGIIPDVALDMLSKFVKARTAKGLKDTDEPLTSLQGLNVWHQARLAEEGIDNVQNLAESDIVDLIVHTRLGVRRLLDWVDQALLSIHVKYETFTKEYQENGMRTATAFMAVQERKKAAPQADAPIEPPDLNLATALENDANYRRLTALRRLEQTKAAPGQSETEGS